MTTEEIVAALDALDGLDEERDHGAADSLLLQAVPAEVAEAWERARERIGFWYA